MPNWPVKFSAVRVIVEPRADDDGHEMRLTLEPQGRVERLSLVRLQANVLPRDTCRSHAHSAIAAPLVCDTSHTYASRGPARLRRGFSITAAPPHRRRRPRRVMH